MRLENARIRNYRSAQDVELANVGDLNVLIGKNNAGKSTLLNAMQAFFLCIRSGSIVALNPPIGGSLVDFSNKDSKQSIELTLSFSMSAQERARLIEDIADEAPQLRNAAQDIDPGLLLSISTVIAAPPGQYGWVGQVSLIPRVARETSPASGRLLLRVSEAASRDLLAQHRMIRGLTQDTEAVRRFSQIDEDDFRRLKQEPADRAYSNYLRRPLSDASPAAARSAESALKDAPTLGEFKSGITTLIEKLNEQVASILAEPLSNTVETFSGLQTTVPRFIREILRRVADMTVLYLTEQRQPVGKEEANRLLQLKMQRGGDVTLASIKETVHSLLGVKIDAFASEDRASRNPGAEMDVDDFLLEVNGSGIREALRLILDVKFKRPQILLVEEPEVHLHPGLEIGMMRFLKAISLDCQVFISTHSTNFLDMGEMRNVYLVSKDDRATTVQLLDMEDAESVLPKELGMRLSSLFMFDRLVFVEGVSDESIIREWASTLGVNLNQAGVGFINIGGARNFGHYATDAIFGFLTRRQVDSWFILDRDERTDQEIADLKSRLGAAVKVVVLGAREIENLLLSPPALEKFVRSKWAAAGLDGSRELNSAVIAQALDECADTLRQLVIDKRIAHSLLGAVRPRIDWTENPPPAIRDRIDGAISGMRERMDSLTQRSQQVIDEQSRAIDAAWSRNKLLLAPGEELLDRVCKKFGVRFKKNVDGPKLAAVMGEHEIDADFKQLIRDMAGR